MRWNRIRRRLTRELDTQLSDWREEALNNLLWGAWEEYTRALTSGETVELEASYETWIARALNETIQLPAPSEQ